jgi:hypothetical protein
MEVDKLKDILEAVYIKVWIGNKHLLTKIAEKKGGISKVFKGQLGAPVATLIRANESPEDAYRRACLDDIALIPVIKVTHKRTKYQLSNGSVRFVYGFEGDLDEIPKHEDREFTLLDDEELRAAIREGKVAETHMVLV